MRLNEMQRRIERLFWSIIALIGLAFASVTMALILVVSTL